MKEFLLLIRAKGQPMAKRPKDEQARHIEKVSEYVAQLTEEGKLIAVQPLKPQGAIVMKNDDKMSHLTIDVEREIVSGYYHIKAFDLDEAIKIAKADPRFELGPWKIEVRPLLKMEEIEEEK
jgi:hypothetical protein